MKTKNDKKIDNGNEYYYTKNLIKRIENDAIRERIENLLIWYIRESTLLQIWYYILTIISIVSGASIPIISLFNDFKSKDIIISIVSALGVLSLSMCTLFSVEENWKRYRRYAEILKRETFQYISKSGVYLEGKKNKSQLFIDRIEMLTSAETEEWYKLKTDNSNSESQAKQESKPEVK